MRTDAPKACGGRFDLNLDVTTPPLPCGRVTRPQMTRIFEPRTSLFARYTYATRCMMFSENCSGAEGRGRTDLAEVELSVLLVGDALDLEEGGVGVGVALAALVAEDAALAVESARQWSAFLFHFNPISRRISLHPSPAFANVKIHTVWNPVP